ncbi:bifunctional transcriptional activator/DNA repair enzyme AdaA [Bacillus mobilis]|uniref:bifunctional transcriptional activator/DNA repair enzyme AdaA n=1 Tax=Bacillus mobilis TaxID=2026190 RepID=UPI000BEC4AB1|nr:bifunctional transcriptional activator/DNA repair enzyme AdaA [Bacillus mobilis]PEC53328.1 AraC family transcriptional regulator [Bacillus cereus]MED0871610.1 bifunctional transcriptional activator/DNA repair enzyme AdaA [Bacillus mobilis]MED0931256.1 bifunctional transcriptional activator/DNA repair enzyme AdaA [Bacillus mobilis]MED0938849.1 bifunctional transcriptional activator/DNA repair enzyme AdaA [Bacillus mobilis]MED0955250.1 bifunctional transcriptional activator/DNA repair enzyme 
MHNEGVTLTNEHWQAIIHNDSSYDSKFFYAVKSTGIFCRPSCKSRIPNRNNVRIFHHAEQALSENFRPCKRCKPHGLTLPNEEWVEQIKDYIEKHFDELLTLDILAEMCHGSPFHLQRTFKKTTGISPIEYILQFRIVKAAEQLLQTNQSIKEISTAVGIENPEYFATLFKKKTGFTPTEYRKKNEMKEGYNNEFQQK